MKKNIIAIVASIFFCSTGFAEHAWVKLNNGSIIEGEVFASETEVVIDAANGRQYTYPLLEIYEITYERPTKPEVKNDPDLKDYLSYDKGFWIRGTVGGSYSLSISHKCTPLIDFGVAGGYRFNQYLKVGIGLGGRAYLQNSQIRAKKSAWSIPLYATIEGNFINDNVLTCTPYYAFDLGGAFQDGFMMRPTIGLRIGQSRSAFLLGITYTGQCLDYYIDGKTKFVSCLGLTLGYEY